MRRKFISALLFGALVTASTSTFVSCKDYDDDINGLQGQITTNASTLEELVNEKVSNLTTEIETLKTQDANLSAALEQAKADLAAAIEEARAAAGNAEQAAKEYTDIKAEEARVAAIEAAQQAVKDAQDKLQAGIDAANASLEEVNGKVATHEEQIAALLDADNSLTAAITEANGKIEAAQNTANEALAAANEANEQLETVLASLETVKAGLDQQIALLDGKVAANADAIAKNKAEVEAELEKVNSAIESNNEAIAALQGKDTELAALIDANTMELEGIKTNLEALGAAIEANLTAAKSYTDSEIAALKAALGISAEGVTVDLVEMQSDLETAQATLEDIVKALQSEDGSIGNVSSAIKELREKIGEMTGTVAENLKTTNDAIESVKGVVAELEGKLATNTTDIADLKERVGALEGQLTEWAGGVDKVASSLKEMDETIAAHGDEIARLLGLSKQLKGLVFNPTMYYQGIEAIGIKSFNYNAITAGLATPDLNKNQANDGSSITKATSETSVVPVVAASYWLNPSGASIDTATANVKDHYAFVINNAQYTRAAQESDITVDSARYVEGKRGLINVYFSMKNANNIAKIPATGDGNVDVAALRYTYTEDGKDTTVMSDFAALKQYTITKFTINKADNANADDANSGHNHLATKASDAVKLQSGSYTAPTLEIAYNNDKGIDLDEWINVHYDINGQADKYWGDQDEVNKKRFKLVYELIGYKASDADNTNESQHATINAETNVLTVHGVNGEQGSRKIIGRTPLVRVKLIDENSNGQVAAVGYILVKITDVTTEPVKVDDIAAITSAYTVVCDNNTALNGVKAITWLEVEDKVLGLLDMSKEEFEANYELDMVASQTYAKQYDYDGKANKFVERTGSNGTDYRFGQIEYGTDEYGHTTNILTWTVGNNAAYNYFVTKKNEEISVYVLFKAKSTVSGHRDVYVKVTWRPSAVNASPVAEILNTTAHKSEADWHAANSRGAGWDELHLQVGNSTVQGATCEYENLVVSKTFNTNPLDILKAGLTSGGYSALVTDAKVSYQFDESKLDELEDKFSGYSFTVKSENGGTANVLRASVGGGTQQAVATIDNANGTIKIVENQNTKNLINIYESGQLAKALTLPVVIKPTTCEPADGLVKLNNNQFDVRVIKPIFIVGASIKDMELNNASTLTQPLALSFEDFNEYDPLEFYENSMSKVTFWSFYGVSKIEVDEANIKTDYRGNGFQNLDPSVFTVSYTAPTGAISLNNMGSVTLNQVNMSRANDFQVQIPVTVTYKWGQLSTTVTLNVKAAPGQNRAPRH